MSDRRGSWYLLTGVLIGLALGLVYAWLISPVAYVDTDPATLRKDFKDAYRSEVAAAYAATGNLPRARLRLALLKEADPVALLVAQAQSALAQGGSQEQENARHLALLAVDLGKSPGKTATATVLPSLTITPTPSTTPTATVTLSPTFTPIVVTATFPPSQTMTSTETVPSTATPTRTPVPTLSVMPSLVASTSTPVATLAPPFILQKRQQVCDTSLPEALLQVQVTDAAGQPLPGIEIRVTWPGGEDHFFTGLKPELGEGYADFVMTPGTTYSAQLAVGSQIANNLNVPDCSQAGGANYWGGWLLIFNQ